MLVRCPKCRTTYKVSDELLKGSAPAFRCSRCKHTFDLESHGAPESASDESMPPDTATAAPAQDEELKLPFEAKQSAHLSEAAKIDSIAEQHAIQSRDHADDDWSIQAPGSESEPSFVLTENSLVGSPKVLDETADSVMDDRFFSKTAMYEEPEDDDNILAIASYRDQRASILPFVSLFGLLIVGFGLFSVISYANPQTSEGVIKTVPLIGRSILRNNHLQEGILVQSLRSSYQTIQGNREVFLISGVALNQNAEVVREIQLSGITYNEEGKELERQTIWAGNTISPKIIRGMTIEDIPHLQDLKPLRSFEIPPGDSIPFTIVFLKSAKNAATFSCDVLAAEGAI